MASLEPVQTTVRVQLTQEQAFARFTHDFHSWWPPQYTWSQAVLVTIGIEPHQDGLCFEIGPRGFRIDWGRVQSWAPPRSLVLLWQIGPHRDPQPDPRKASEVEVRFAAVTEALTEVTLIHRHFDRHGEGGADYREAMGSPGGWPYILRCFAAAG